MNTDIVTLWGFPPHLRTANVIGANPECAEIFTRLITTFPNWDNKRLVFVTKNLPIIRMIGQMIDILHNKKDKIRGSVSFIDLNEYLTKAVRYEKHEIEATDETQSKMRGSDLLILKDLGHSILPNNARLALGVILNKVILWNTPTIITTSVTNLPDTIGEGLFDTLTQNFDIKKLIKSKGK